MSILFAGIQSQNVYVTGKYYFFSHVYLDYCSSDEDINTNNINYCVSSNSTSTNVNIVNIKTDHEEEDEGRCSTEKEDQWVTASAILNILLKNPKEFELLTKPSAIRESKRFTINSNNKSLESVKCDDNGSYLSKGIAKNLYYWESDKEEAPCSANFDKINQTWLIKQRTRSNCYEDVQVEQEKVYEIRRTYRQNKNNPWLTQCISTIKPVSASPYNSYYLVIYKVNKDNKDTFIMPSHGNTVNSHAPPYYRQEPSVKAATDERLTEKIQGWSTEKI